MGSIREVYESLVDRIESLGIYIIVNGRLGGELEDGYFDGKRKVIAVWRNRGGIRGHDSIIRTVEDPLRETIILAHELGHYRSFLAGLAEGYEAARDIFCSEQNNGVDESTLTHAQKKLVLHEEQLAWTLGREDLRELRFSHWEDYDARERDGLAEYRRRLRLT